MAYLVRRPKTHLIRILLLPITLLISLRAGFSFAWLEPRYNAYNYGAALFSVNVIAKALEFAFAADGCMKIDETAPGQSTIPAIATRTTSSTEAKASLSVRPLGGLIPLPLSDAMELLCSMRGIGFKIGQGVAIPSETRPLNKGPFLRATSYTFLVSFLCLDLIDSTLKLTPPLRHPGGGSIFIPDLSWPMRYTVSTCLHFSTGVAIYAGIEMVYSLLTIFSVVVLRHSPNAWPPVFDNPWGSQSLHEFWALRWHQLLRQTFMVYGGLPGGWIGQHIGIGKSLGMLFGTFLASGLYHELACYAMGHGFHWQVPAFFLLHASLVLLERTWRKTTGRRVGGWPGTVWVYFTIVVLGQNLIDSWHRRGLGSSMVIPPVLSPTRKILFPVLTHLADQL
ncbi:hypothetical protein K439DRAFT_1363127 [Ramaria rubella]|nr:hypothetical protein K439DRAFT_1363127 [Ramaria rubella]